MLPSLSYNVSLNSDFKHTRLLLSKLHRIHNLYILDFLFNQVGHVYTNGVFGIGGSGGNELTQYLVFGRDRIYI